MIKIDTNIPVPVKSQTHALTKYPWKELKVNESFFIPDKTKIMMSPQIVNVKRKLNIKLYAENTTENNIKGVRIWRTE